uniref:FAM86 N-terminal domain-containing protein n=1 Tax=Chromera velia CCMP2878 TaxID=1169474 RepID=A0A0G4I342_9ALVE|eukprot:Cvel_1745.t1-p1 / transcript=Cvel_1745.t1 / gene=Cvel_1745 / organism=Chromera_velia_CCMP2878 / gene_product=Putative uncharacterized protein DDB_G0277003, putative / transcript_product=Putative uncharacterized protein DDB_G0277003, putative / location=Cvel_scaffold63:122301-126707(-) / protein_length=1014 / sequence_SO=supercontig / SO=protein_coding / is_pseudo=false
MANSPASLKGRLPLCHQENWDEALSEEEPFAPLEERLENVRRLYLRQARINEVLSACRLCGVQYDTGIQEEFVKKVLDHPTSLRHPPGLLYTTKLLRPLIFEIRLRARLDPSQALTDAYARRMNSYCKSEQQPPSFRTYVIPPFYEEGPRENAPSPSVPVSRVMGLAPGEREVTLRVQEDESAVGLRTWTAGFFLAGFALENEEEFRGRKVLELGAGVGFPTVVAGLRVPYGSWIATDHLRSVLDNLHHNCSLNGVSVETGNHREREKPGEGRLSSSVSGSTPLFPRAHGKTEKLKRENACVSDKTVESPAASQLVLEKLDWREDPPERFEEIMREHKIDLIVASDVIYHSELTRWLIRALCLLLSCRSSQSLSQGREGEQKGAPHPCLCCRRAQKQKGKNIRGTFQPLKPPPFRFSSPPSPPPALESNPSVDGAVGDGDDDPIVPPDGPILPLPTQRPPASALMIAPVCDPGDVQTETEGSVTAEGMIGPAPVCTTMQKGLQAPLGESAATADTTTGRSPCSLGMSGSAGAIMPVAGGRTSCTLELYDGGGMSGRTCPCIGIGREYRDSKETAPECPSDSAIAAALSANPAALLSALRPDWQAYEQQALTGSVNGDPESLRKLWKRSREERRERGERGEGQANGSQTFVSADEGLGGRDAPPAAGDFGGGRSGTASEGGRGGCQSESSSPTGRSSFSFSSLGGLLAAGGDHLVNSSAAAWQRESAELDLSRLQQQQQQQQERQDWEVKKEGEEVERNLQPHNRKEESASAHLPESSLALSSSTLSALHALHRDALDCACPFPASPLERKDRGRCDAPSRRDETSSIASEDSEIVVPVPACLASKAPIPSEKKRGKRDRGDDQFTPVARERCAYGGGDVAPLDLSPTTSLAGKLELFAALESDAHRTALLESEPRLLRVAEETVNSWSVSIKQQPESPSDCYCAACGGVDEKEEEVFAYIATTIRDDDSFNFFWKEAKKAGLKIEIDRRPVGDIFAVPLWYTCMLRVSLPRPPR